MPIELPLPLIPGDWKPLTANEAMSMVGLLRNAFAPGVVPAPLGLPLRDLRALPLSFYPGWLLVEGEVLLEAGQVGTFDLLYGPGLVAVLNGESQLLRDLNTGALPTDAEPSQSDAHHFGSPLVALDPETTGPDYLRFYCATVWGEHGAFRIIEKPDAPELEGYAGEDQRWRDAIKPVVMSRDGDALSTRAVVNYADALFVATLRIEHGLVRMDDDEPLAEGFVARVHKAPLRDVRGVAGTTSAGSAA